MVERLNITYERKASKSFAILNEINDIKNYQLNMVCQNDIPNLLTVMAEVHNNQFRFYYDITSKQKLTHVLERKALDYEELKTLILGIMNINKQCEAYLLSEHSIVLDPKYIYMDAASFQPYFMYIPLKEKVSDIMKQTNDIILYLFDKVDKEDMNAIMLMYNLYNLTKQTSYHYGDIETLLYASTKLCKEERKLSEQKHFLDEAASLPQVQEKKEVKVKKNRMNGNSSIKSIGIILMIQGIVGVLFLLMLWGGFLNDAYSNQMSLKHILTAVVVLICLDVLLCKKQWAVIKKIKQKMNKQSVEKQDINHENKNHSIQVNTKEKENDPPIEKFQPLLYYEQTNKASPTHETTFLNTFSMQEKKEACLIHKISERQIKIHKTPFIVGKLDTEVDYVIKNISVSRIHSKIIQKDQSYYIMDLNSKNGTYLDGKCIKSNEMYELKHNSLITFSNEDYIFKLN